MPARQRTLTVLALIALALSLVAAAEQSNSWSIFGPARPEGHTRSGGWRGSRVVVPTPAPAPAPVEEPQPAAPQPAQDEYTPTNVEDVGAADAPSGGPKTAVAESGPAAAEATPMAVTEADPVAVEAYPVEPEAQPAAAEAQPVAAEEAAPQPVVDEAGAAPAQTDAAAQPQATEQQDGQQGQAQHAEGRAQQSEGAEQQQEADQEDANAPKLTAASGEGATTTQAGCACLENWEDAEGKTHSGCTNPNNDPQGAWCAVDAQQCPGFYSVYRDRMSRIVHYDYCSEVRERTTNGCLCDAEWKLEGYGKEIYRNRCAHPDNETTRKCRVNAATCPPGVTLEGSYDTCTPAAGRFAAPAVMRTRTFNGCNCLNGGWWYLYPGNDAPENPIAPVNKTIFGCANPDGDPLGAWCAVNPGSCDRFVGYIRMDAKTTWAFDYCDSKRPGALVVKRNGCRPDAIPEWGQCGGKSNCSEWGCADEQWAGACCGNALICDRQDPYYWQCIKPGTRMNTQGPAALAAAAGDAAPAAANEAGLAAGSPQVVSALPGIGGAYPLPPVEPPALPAFSGPGLPALKRREPGATVYVNLKINYPYELLIADVGAQARFKSDVVGWLKSAAGPAEFVHGAGVDEIVNGSVVAVAHVVYTADAPEELVSKAPAAIKTGAERLYKSSALPASWGPLMAMESAANRNSLTLRPSEQSAIPVQQLGLCPGGNCSAAAAAPAESGPARWWHEFLRLPPGMYAGMGGGALMVLLVTAVIARVVARALVANRGVDADKDAQLAYMNELTEGDLHTELDGTVKADSIVDPGPIGTRQNRLLLWLGGLPQPEEEDDDEVEIALAHIQMPSKAGAPKAAHLEDDETGEIAASPRSQAQATLRNPAAPDGPDPAFLPLPDGEGARRSSGGAAGAAPASLTHRRVSAAVPPAAAPAAAALAPPPQARVAANSGGGGIIGGALGRLGSAVATFVSGGGAAPAVEVVAEGSDKPAKEQ